MMVEDDKFEETIRIKGTLTEDEYDEYQHALQELMKNFGLNTNYISTEL